MQIGTISKKNVDHVQMAMPRRSQESLVFVLHTERCRTVAAIVLYCQAGRLIKVCTGAAIWKEFHNVDKIVLCCYTKRHVVVRMKIGASVEERCYDA